MQGFQKSSQEEEWAENATKQLAKRHGQWHKCPNVKTAKPIHGGK